MSSTPPAIAAPTLSAYTGGTGARVRVPHAHVQVALAWLCIAVLGAWTMWRVEEGRLRTVLLLAVVVFGGLWMIGRLRKELDDPRIQRIGYIYLAKFPLVFFVLYAGWVPELLPSSAEVGYDAQRFYFQAMNLADHGFDMRGLHSLNYAGILFYFGILFSIFGHNPVVPALVNMLTTLIAIAWLVRVGHLLRTAHGYPPVWWLGAALLVPELVWFDALSSRESIAMTLLVISALTAATFLLAPGRHIRARLWLLPGGMLLLGLIRTSLLLPALCTLLMYFLTFKLSVRRRLAFGILAGVAIGVFVLAPLVGERLGSYKFEVSALYSLATSRDEKYLADMKFTDRSLTMLIIPDTPLEAVAFAPIRMMFYVVAPLPTIRVDLASLIAGYWDAWQSGLSLLSALFYLSCFPLAIASLIWSIRQRDERRALAIHVPAWATFLAISAGNVIVHERYRIIAIPFLCGAIWLGLSTPMQLRFKVYAAWGGLWFSALAFYVGYKFLFS